MIEAGTIAKILGGPNLLGRKVRSVADLDALVHEGLPKRSLSHTIDWFTCGKVETRTRLRGHVVAQATWHRGKGRLNAGESEVTERLARVFATARHVFDDDEMARAFLGKPHPEFGGRAPADVAGTEFGARRVEDILWNIYFGLAA
jgi:putative toxin-antitoxin system antitoxin component (TIGR02293 family)